MPFDSAAAAEATAFAGAAPLAGAAGAATAAIVKAGAAGAVQAGTCTNREQQTVAFKQRLLLLLVLFVLFVLLPATYSVLPTTTYYVLLPGIPTIYYLVRTTYYLLPAT